MKPRVAEFAFRRIAPVKHTVGVEILSKICSSFPSLVSVIMDSQKPVSKAANEHYTCTPSFQQKGEQIGLFVEQVLKWFCDRGRDENMRQLGRRLGQVYYHSNLQFSAEQWKTVRAQVVSIIVHHSVKEPATKEGSCSNEELQEYLTRVFNFVLCEMRSGLLCAAVEEKNRTNRSAASGVWSTPQDVPKKPRSQRCRSFQHNGLLSTMDTEIPLR